jgi:hypothetical protein
MWTRWVAWLDKYVMNYGKVTSETAANKEGGK